VPRSERESVRVHPENNLESDEELLNSEDEDKGKGDIAKPRDLTLTATKQKHKKRKTVL